MSGNVYFEIYRFGNSVKITAIDEDTGLEAVAIVPASLPQSAMKQQALKKLEYIKRKKDEK
jgi:hypothetical protein